MGALKSGYQVTNEIALVRRLGAGGMGTVWLARHAKLGAEVVVKFLSESLAADSDACERFSREVTATVQVRSPHVVQTLDHGITESGIPYLVMELLEGQDLAKVIRQRGTLRPDEVNHVVEGVAAALTKAHERGIVHRDIKPANIFLCSANPRPFVKLVDFGIAKRLEDQTMTATNALLGTPAYMSPEQMNGAGDIDHRTDLWALGILTYHMLTGGPPFRGAHIANIAHAIFEGTTPKITTTRTELPAAVDVWLERALHRRPEGRFASARELADALALALGDLAYASTRKMRGSGEAPVIVPTPNGSVVVPAGSAPQLGFDGVGTTLGPSAVTQNTFGASSRMKWWIVAMAIGGVLLIGAAFRIGYGIRRVEATTPPAAAAATPAPTPSTTPTPPAPAHASVVASATAAPEASTTPTASATTIKKQPPRNPGKRGPRPGEDDVGF